MSEAKKENVIFAWGLDTVDDITHPEYIELIEKRVQKVVMKYLLVS